jgi:ABC-type amino acid transport substrate-binding protein
MPIMRASLGLLFLSAATVFACSSDKTPSDANTVGGGGTTSVPTGGTPSTGGTHSTGGAGGGAPAVTGGNTASQAGSPAITGGIPASAGTGGIAPTGGIAGAPSVSGEGGGAGAKSEGGASGTPSTAGAGSGGASAGQGGAQTFPDLKITSDTKSIEFTPALVAAEDFYPGKATVASGGIVTLLQDSTVDLGTNAETQTLRQSVMYPNLRIIFTVTETFYRIVANRQAGIETLEDLEGKRIASISNTSAAYFIYKYLGTVNVTEYTLVSGGICMATPCGASTLPGLVESGDADAIALWEPSTEIAAQALGDDAVIFQDRTLYREIVNLHSTAEKLADPETRRAIVEFVRSLIKAQQQFRENPESIYPRIVDAIGIQQPVLEAAWHDERYGGELVPDILDVLEEEEPWVAAQTNRTPRTREELAPLVDDSIAREALGSP